MRVVAYRVAEGTAYRIYRADDDFEGEFAKVVPPAFKQGLPVRIGETRDDPDVVVTVGPLNPLQDAFFRAHLSDVLTARAAAGKRGPTWKLDPNQ